MNSKDEFYIGYLRKLPPRQWRFLQRLLPVLVVGFLALALILPSLHFEQFHLGKVSKSRDFVGFLLAEPAPHLLVPRPGNTEQGSDYSVYLLSGTNKKAPKPTVMAHAGKWVTLKGIPVYRNQFTVLAARSADPADPPAGQPPDLPQQVSLGQFSLEGEILDSKCYPGVMRPGRTKTHKACAIRCISGGVPAVFRVHNQQGDTLYLLLADPEGRAVNEKILAYVADPIKITGEVVQYGDTFILKADPSTYERA